MLPWRRATYVVSVTLAAVLVLFAVPATEAGCQFPISVQTNRSAAASGSRRSHKVATADDSGHSDVQPPRDWVTRVRDQFTEFDHEVTISGNVMRTVSSSSSSSSFSSSSSSSRRGSNGRAAASSSPVIQTRVCIQVFQNDRFLVAHELPGQQGARYSCVQFVHRSPDVVQIREAPVGDRMERSMCRDSALRLDRWLMVDRNRLRGHHGGSVACPLSGGFSMHIFDKGRNEGVCDAYLGETRIESECQRGDGLIFRYRRQSCVPQDLYMYSTQQVTCLVTWTEAAVGSSSLSAGATPVLHAFTLLRHSEQQRSYYWLLRTPAAIQSTSGNGGQQFAAYLFKDLVADTSNAVNETRNYIRFDAVRDRVRSEECADEYDICSDLSGSGHASSIVQSRCNGIGVGTSNIDFRLTCPLTCGLCNSTLPVRCNLPPSWNGQWRTQLATGSGGSGAPAAAVTTTTINSTSIASSKFDESWHCIQWNATSSSNNEVMLMTDFNNGCRRRYRCARVVRQTAALVYLHVSRAAAWPITRSGRDPIDCRAFLVDVPPTDVDAVVAGVSGSYMAALFSDDDGDEVTCDVPSDLIDYAIVSSSSSDSTNSTCSASLTQLSSRTRVQLDVRCNDEDDVSQLPVGLKRGLTSFACLASFRSAVNSVHQIVVARLVYSTDDDPEASHSLVCWMMTSGSGERQPRSFQMFVGSQCDAVVLRTSSIVLHRTPSSADPLPSTATFKKTTLTATVADSSPDIASPSTSTTRRPNRSTKSPRPTPAAGSTVDPTSSDVDNAADSGTKSSILPPRLLNSTSTDGEVETTSKMIGNAFTVAMVVFILAVVQAIALCRC